MTAVHWTPPALKIQGGGIFPARHVWCIGRNYAEHAREMGADPAAAEPIFFAKPAAALLQAERVQYPAHTTELHHEVELVVALGQGGRDLDAESALACVACYAVGVDLTRRDVQAKAKAAGHPWEMSKAFDQSGPLGLLVPAADFTLKPGAEIRLEVDGEVRQRARLGDMIWNVGELLALLSARVTLQPGDLVFTGTPAGVGPLAPGDQVRAEVEGLPGLKFQIAAD
ncbi:MAG: fumarylacetoacetate hydrolase family protein [Wenzhouxiangella sp.]